MSERIRSDERTFFGIKANGPVFVTSLLIVLGLVITTLIVGKPMEQWFSNTQTFIADRIGWFFILMVNGLLIFALFLGFSKFGSIRLGGEDAKPEFSKMGWFSMLFSAGMGIGLLFWSVAEPIFHFSSNPFLDDPENKIMAARQAMGVTFTHWGVHAWALYAIVGSSFSLFYL